MGQLQRWRRLTVALFSLLVAQGSYADDAPISAAARAQIAEILALKDSLSAPEKKLSSHLMLQARVAAGKSLGAAASFVRTNAADTGTLVRVDVGGTISAALREAIEQNGGEVENASEQYGRLVAKIPLGKLTAVAAQADLKWMREASRPRRNVGALTTQGYVTHGANLVTNATGAGVKVGVISDSARPARVSALQASADLGPMTTVLSGQDGSGIAGVEDEGTAMMEIVQDMAPGAQLYFATGFQSEVSFASNIAALAAAGCTIIVDDVTYGDEGAFQDDIIAQAVNTFTAGGGLYFSSAANSGNLTLGTSGTWEGDFLDGGAVAAPLPTTDATARVHNFGTAGSPQSYDVITSPSPFSDYTLQWSDPLGASTNDYDLFILNSTGTSVIDFSTNVQNGTQDPFEEIYNPNAFHAGDRIVIVKHTGAASRFLRIDTSRGQLGLATSGSTFGHNAAKTALTIAAVYWNSAANGTKLFTTNDVIETFSSDGPRRIFYNPNGTAITPGNFSSTGGQLLSKPDLAAADGGECKTPGFLPFHGTSAAAPHAAGIAALVKSANPTLTAAQVKTILYAAVLDIMSAGIDRDAGHGILLAKPAVDAAVP